MRVAILVLDKVSSELYYPHMHKGISITAPAKVNLHLDIQARRPDGFHELQSLFVMISLGDKLRVHRTDDKNFNLQGCGNLPLKQNLIWKAYRSYCEEAEEYLGVQVDCRKNIPAMAGLGGGSSDAAAMLRLLQLIHPVKLDRRPLLRIAAELGSDVPFFLHSPSALVEGRGEIIKAIETPAVWNCVVVKPDIDVATREAYALLDEFSGKAVNSLSSQEILDLYKLPPQKWTFFNSFTPVLLHHYPQLIAWMQLLYEQGADYVNVSGSGSALFGVFRDVEKADSCYTAVKKSIKMVWKVKMLASLPEAVYN
ncbi:MAG: 4-(cytidine 5'-diphospho)-2-C-methyl-D-erythritol kinase [Spirochaetaceae bacterium]|nr:4-(cytidine 5'-diphospho)-2-C-methyl-D-erythritol kinase [Spirochaetaceae bacterium]MCF7950877.1 4-(cytidine 5'-diphospho)-2-C-methyl-D-erythritol kinase [Spirochaetaceae bacterium]